LYLKPDAKIEALFLDNEIIQLKLPIKMDFKVIDCPPSFKGDSAVSNFKTATIETGAKVSVPMFIKIGDVIRINTETGTYIERVKKN
jgi:elongation factor P